MTKRTKPYPGERYCANCHGPIGQFKRADSLFCSKECLWSSPNHYSKKLDREHRRYLSDKQCVVERVSRWNRLNPDKHGGYVKKWNASNKHVINEGRRRRQAAEIMATPVWLVAADLEAMRKIYKHAIEQQTAHGVKFHVDHIVPLQGNIVCGLHVPWNLQVIPAHENQIKHNKVLEPANQ